MKRGSVLPLNYQYPLSSWIYKCINRADSEFASFLHQQGYTGARAGKPFKFFTFSKLDVPKREIYEDRMIIQSEAVYFTLSFLIEQAAEKFITGVFQQQHVGIGDKKSQVDFEVSGIEARPTSVRDQIVLRTASPIVVSKPEMRGDKMHATFLSPEDEGYKNYFLQNLIRKYESYASYTGDSISTTFDQKMDWEMMQGSVRSRLVTIKANTPAETRVRGYDYIFKLTAPEPLVRIGLLAGFGEKNSLGFGCVMPAEARLRKTDKTIKKSVWVPS
ncbi:MAG: CRISPR-associated endoribonuclease Cas6 [Cyclobacteriaceae bacterium]